MKQKINRPTHAYIGRKPCGCVVCVCIDAHDKDTAKSVAEYIREGLAVERVPFGTPEYSEMINHLGCEHVETEPNPQQLSMGWSC